MDLAGRFDSRVVMTAASDGFPLALQEFNWRQLPLRTQPVVLCPGYAGNRYNLDLDESHSLARHLAKEGYRVWIAELRGHGRSKRSSSKTRRGQDSWNLDDHVERDVPAILDAVATRTGEQSLTWIGHSLGGMVAYCRLARYPKTTTALQQLVTIGSPGVVERRKRLVRIGASIFARSIGTSCRLPTRGFMRLLFSRTARRMGFGTMHRYWMNPSNITDEVLDTTMRIGIEDFSVGTLKQLALSMESASLLSADGGFDYFANLRHLSIPVLFIGGTLDYLAPPASILAAFESVSSLDRTIRIFGPDGFEIEGAAPARDRCDRIGYGHDDLVLGDAARFEVFPYISEWLSVRCDLHGSLAAEGEG